MLVEDAGADKAMIVSQLRALWHAVRKPQTATWTCWSTSIAAMATSTWPGSPRCRRRTRRDDSGSDAGWAEAPDPRPRAPGGRRPVRRDDERLLLSRLLPLQNQLQTTKSLFQENLSTDKPDRTLGVCQPRQEAALRPAATNGLGAQSRPVEHRHADDAVARGAAIAKCRYRRRDSDPLG
ncbi:MAG: hypothetical protein JWL68_5067 [Actinomycetia bacterium]|nr:hypothetical protein [Actinomycetes bacterium]